MFKNMKIGTRLQMGFGVATVLLVIILALSLGKLSTLFHEIDDLVNDNVPKANFVGDIKDNVNENARLIRNIILMDDQSQMQKEAGQMSETKKLISDRIEKLDKMIDTAEGRALFKAMSDARTPFVEGFMECSKLALAGKKTEAKELLFAKVRPAQLTFLEKIQKLNDYQDKLVSETGKQAIHVYHTTRILLLVIGAASILFSIVIAVWITRSITVPVAPLVSAARQIAEGNLNVRINHTSNDEIGQLSDSFRDMTENLRAMIMKVTDTAQQVAAAANQLHTTAERIATGAEEVAAQTGTVATAGEEMSATSGDIAQNCQGASEGAHRASQSARNGAEVVEKTVAVMGQIADKVQESAKTVESLGARSDQIGEIIGTIEDIADQTNLLALNAAIEAARAGEQGRGFAVVADEVRALAERTTRATREIGEMIKAIQQETKGAVAAMEQGVHQVESGTAEAARSGDALRDILAQVNEVAMQVSQIATAAEEQTATTSEIANNMQQITEVVQHTSQGAQESATAAAQLSGNAEELQRLVRQFKL